MTGGAGVKSQAARREARRPWWRLRGAGLALALTLTACGGGGGGTPTSPEAPADPPLTRLKALTDRANILLHSDDVSHSTVTAAGETVQVPLREPVSCPGTPQCTTTGGQANTIPDLLTQATGTAPTLGARDGFATLTTTTPLDSRTEPFTGGTLTTTGTFTSYGFWGTDGFAAVVVTTGPLTGTLDGAPLRGTFTKAQAYAWADASRSNPSGTGSATWTGPVEAATTTATTFQRLTGTVRLHMPNLAQPRLDVTVTVPHHTIGPPGGWAALPLTAGRFATGTPGRDRLAGTFAGDAHAEAWGFFDVTGYVGAFGATRR